MGLGTTLPNHFPACRSEFLQYNTTSAFKKNNLVPLVQTKMTYDLEP